MHDVRRSLLALGLLALVVAAVAGLRASSREAVASSPTSLLTTPVRNAGLTFAPEVLPADQQVIQSAIARSRPEARRLIEAVDGLVTVHVQVVGGQAVGMTRGAGRRFDVLLDLGRVWHESGQRGVDRLILHELGHVVDFVLVPGPLKARLDAGIPAGYGCDAGQPTGACAEREERFAETFSKWATGDLGFDIRLGYKVLPPTSLEEWGRPLVTLPVG